MKETETGYGRTLVCHNGDLIAHHPLSERATTQAAAHWKESRRTPYAKQTLTAT